jgi:diguanylate cyclase (GGDEF)-like protein
MKELIDSVANLTGFRDRDMIDVSVAAVLNDWLQPEKISLFKLQGELSQPRLFVRAEMKVGDTVPSSGPPWLTLEDLPLLSDFPVRAECVAENKSAEWQTESGSWVGVYPVASESHVLGLIEIQTKEALTSAHERLISGVLRIYRNHLALLDYSEHDTLTGLLNRKTFDDSFLKVIGAKPSALPSTHIERRRSPSEELPFWLGVADIDHFKSINDRFGHLIGDEVLLLLARILRSSFRMQDRLYRFGGEEFVILLERTPKKQAEMVFERFRQAVEKFNFPQVGQATASVGFTQVQTLDSPTSAFERADQAVYFAKKNGRNQVRCFETLVEQGHLQGPQTSTGDIELF